MKKPLITSIKYLSLLFLLILLLLPSVVGEDQAVIIKNGQSRDLQVTCTYNGTFCDNTIYGNVTITAPNGTIIVNNAVMTKNGAVYNYTITNTSTLNNGDYLFVPIFYSSTVSFSDSLVFTITPSGTETTVGQSLIYCIGLFILIVLFIACLLSAINLDYRNEITMGGHLLRINYGKYGKIGLFLLAYLILILVNFMAWQVSLNVLYLEFASWLFGLIHHNLWLFATPLFFIVILVYFAKFIVDDIHDLKMMKQGMRVGKVR